MKIRMTISTYIRWIKNDKQVIVLLLLVCLYMYVISPLKVCCNIMNQPLCFVEAYMTFIGNGFCIPLILLAFLVTIIDFPDLSGNIAFILHRCGRRSWYNNQLVFLILAILSFLVLLFAFSLIFTVSISFAINAWSNVMINLNNESIEKYRLLKETYPLAVADLSILNHFRPYTGIFYNTLLTILMFIFHGQLQICLSIKYNRGIGCIASIAVLGLGLVTWASSSKLKWIFPLANSSIGWHYDSLFQETIFPLHISFIYMILINITLYIIGQRIILKKQFFLGGNTND